MGDQGVEPRPALGLEDGGDGARIGGVGRKPIDRLGRQDDKPARTQGADGGVYFTFLADTTMVTATASGTTLVAFHSSCPTPKASRLRLMRAFIFA